MDQDLPDFDREFYLRQYPDVAASGMDPYEHFVHFGINEGRLGARPRLRHFQGAIAFDPSRETVLVVSHEASMTGAPILSLNLVRGLQRTYNVIALLLGGGPLVREFRDACVLSIEPQGRRHHAELARETIAQLTALYPLRFAVVNSVECALVLEPLSRAGVPSLALIHEFAAYTRPSLLFEATFLWASEVVFSTRITYQDVIATLPHLAGRACRFIPQGRCTLLAHELDADHEARELQRIRDALRPAGQDPDTTVVIGIGSVQTRKGVELFIDCAARVVATAQGRPFRFVWVGDGLDAERDVAYSAFLVDQIHRAGLVGRFEFMRTTPLVEHVYALSDIFLLTSRLDPLPGVAIEAMTHRLPTLCFHDTTGIADVLAQDDCGRDYVMPYLDTRAMAHKVVELAASPALRHAVGLKLNRLADACFSMEGYIARLESLALAVPDRASV